MQTYNQFNQGNAMPLLMNFTTPTPIQEAEEVMFDYNDKEQISYEMRTLGTRSLKYTYTKYINNKGSKCTKGDGNSNQMDDRKTVR